jgi:type VI secretion system protein VasI
MEPSGRPCYVTVTSDNRTLNPPFESLADDVKFLGQGVVDGSESVRTLIVFAAIVIGTEAYAQTLEEKLTECVSESDNLLRLQCFDDAVSELKQDDVVEVPAVETDSSDTGAWVVETEVSAIDDSLGVFLTLSSKDPVPGPYGQFGPLMLTLRCMENTTAATIYFNQYFMADIRGGGQVEYRLDDAEAQTLRMVSSSDNMFLGLWSGGLAIPWIKSLLDAERLVVRAMPMNEGAVTGEFDLNGLENVIGQLREECSW